MSFFNKKSLILTVILLLIILFFIFQNLVSKKTFFDSSCTLKYFAFLEDVPFDTCSSFQPLFCEKEKGFADLIPNCNKCSCAKDQVCGSDGHCLSYFLTVPSNVVANKSFEINFRVLDEQGVVNNQSGIIIDLLSLKLTPNVPFEISNSFEYKNGVWIYNVTVFSEGTFYFEMFDENDDFLVKTNPFIIKNNSFQDILWGELHVHCLKEAGFPCHTFEYARHIYDLDFVSETNAPFQTKYSDYKKRYKQFQNDIIIFLGLEWVSNDFYSHHVVLFNNILDFTSLRTFDLINSTPDLWNFLRNKESLTIAAHPTTKICRFSECGVWSNNDDNRVLAEIFSGYAGSAECFGCPYDSSENSPNYLRNAWAKGIKVGVTSISDAFIPGTTMPMPMTSSVPNLGGGLTAVIVSDNSKEAVWDALKSRHTYATTGDRIILYFDINGFLPGDIISTNQALNISVEVVGTATIANLELFKFHDDKYELFASTSSDDEFASMIIQDSVVLNNSFYYVRILQTNGEVAWSSPIWVEG